MSSDNTVHACLIVDDFPSNASYWRREQEVAFGYEVLEACLYSRNWRAQGQAPFMPLPLTYAFAEFVEEFDIKGKLTMLPCPAGLGRIDRSVRGISDGELRECITIVREQFAPRFDITPEVLTHSMALDPESEALLPHTESAWVSYLSATGRQEELRAYLRHGWTILANVGIQAHGVTIGGMDDPSNIAEGKMLVQGYHRKGLAEALLAVKKEFNPDVSVSFIHTGSPPISEASKARRYPEAIHITDAGDCVFEVHSSVGDPLLEVFNGKGDPSVETDKLISPDLGKGVLVDNIEAGKLLMITVHCQTLNALNTGHGLQILREAVRRLRDRYGSRLVWHTPLELCRMFGERREDSE